MYGLPVSHPVSDEGGEKAGETVYTVDSGTIFNNEITCLQVKIEQQFINNRLKKRSSSLHALKVTVSSQSTGHGIGVLVLD